MRINFLTTFSLGQGSVRIRAHVIARELRSLGHHVYVGPTVREGATHVLLKLWSGSLDEIRKAKERGEAVVLDMCDDHSARPDAVAAMKEAAGLADVLTASSPAIVDMFERLLGREALLIEDSYESGESTAAFDPSAHMKLLWYGHSTNFGGVVRDGPEIEKFGTLRVVCNQAMPNYDCTKWNPLAQWQALEWCDAVVLPLTRDEKKASYYAKSNNRVIEAIRRGRFVLAEPIPTYEPLRDWIWLGPIPEGLAWLKIQPREEIVRRIQEAQKYVRQHYNPSRIARQWEAALQQAAAKGQPEVRYAVQG